MSRRRLPFSLTLAAGLTLAGGLAATAVLTVAVSRLEYDNKALAFVLLGVLFNVNAIPVNVGWALAASWMARRATVIQRGMHWLDRVAGAMFIGFGLKLAFTDQPSA